MKKAVLFIIFIFFGMIAISYAQKECTIIPKPQKVSFKEGSFSLEPSTKIITGKGDEIIASRLQKMLEPATGFRFTTATKAKKGDIILS